MVGQSASGLSSSCLHIDTSHKAGVFQKSFLRNLIMQNAVRRSFQTAEIPVEALA